MKNSIIISVLLFSVCNGNAQDTTSFYKPVRGYTVDVSFTPFNGSELISINAINARYFLNPALAARLGFGFELNRLLDDNLLAGDSLRIAKQTTTFLSIRPGVEKHFAGTERLSPYIGAQMIFDVFTSKFEVEEGSDVAEISGATDTDLSNRKYTRFGLGLTLGANYYITKGLFLGVEIGFGFGVQRFGEVALTSGNTTQVISNGSSSALFIGQTFKPALQLGWRF